MFDERCLRKLLSLPHILEFAQHPLCARQSVCCRYVQEKTKVKHNLVSALSEMCIKCYGNRRGGTKSSQFYNVFNGFLISFPNFIIRVALFLLDNWKLTEGWEMSYGLCWYSPQQPEHVGHHLTLYAPLSCLVITQLFILAFKSYCDVALISLLSFIYLFLCIYDSFINV